MVEVTLEQITQLAPNAKPVYREAFQNAGEVLARHGINATPLRVAHFMAQVLHECGGCRILSESFHYSVPRMLEIFGVGNHSAAITPEEAEQLAGNPEALAERVYGLGNPRKAKELGNVRLGDGAKYIGRGMLQMTGRGAYAKFGKILGVDLVGHPELAEDARYMLAIAAEEWNEKGCNEYADDDDIVKVTRAINGGKIGLKERREWLEKTKSVWS
ncbi:MAG TPA: lytic enzyme [Thermoanaerobaculia bacterium]|jgi:putative chitinase